MERINTSDGLFVDGDPFNGIPGTPVTAAWLNSQQEELVSVVEAADLALDQNNSAQLLLALSTLIERAAGDAARRFFMSQF